MISYIKLLATGIFSFILVSAPLVFADDQLPTQPYVLASAEGSIQAYPDQVRLQIGIAETATTLVMAKQSVDELSGQVISAALAHGMQKADVESSQIFASRHEEWQNNKSIYIGERVQRSITIVTRDLSQYSEMMAAILAVPKPAKYREVRIDQLLFEFQDQRIVENQALEQALINVKNKAQLMAKTLNASLGKVYRITDANLSVQPMLAYQAKSASRTMALMEADAPPAPNSELQIGKQKITQSVQVIFLLTP